MFTSNYFKFQRTVLRRSPLKNHTKLDFFKILYRPDTPLQTTASRKRFGSSDPGISASVENFICLSIKKTIVGILAY